MHRSARASATALKLVADLRLHAKWRAVGTSARPELHGAQHLRDALVVVAIAGRCEIEANDPTSGIDVEFGDEMQAANARRWGQRRQKEFDGHGRIVGLGAASRAGTGRTAPPR